jgi:hypothetical protein
MTSSRRSAIPKAKSTQADAMPGIRVSEDTSSIIPLQSTWQLSAGIHGPAEELTGQSPYETRAFQYIWFNKQHDESIKRKLFKAGSMGMVMGGIFFNDKTAFKLALYDFTGLCHFENITTGGKTRVTRRLSTERFWNSRVAFSFHFGLCLFQGWLLLLLFAFMTTARCALFASVSFCEDKFGFLDSTAYIYFVRPLHRIFKVYAHHRSEVRSLTIRNLLGRPSLIFISTEALSDLEYTITAYLASSQHIPHPSNSFRVNDFSPSSTNTIYDTTRYEHHRPNNIAFNLVASRTTKTTISTLITLLASAQMWSIKSKPLATFLQPGVSHLNPHSINSPRTHRGEKPWDRLLDYWWPCFAWR